MGIVIELELDVPEFLVSQVVINASGQAFESPNIVQPSLLIKAVLAFSPIQYDKPPTLSVTPDCTL